MKIGAHVSASGGYMNVFKRTEEIGADCFQMFVSSPRMWSVPALDSKVGKEFKEVLEQKKMNPSYVHIKYLVNLVSPTELTVEKSIKCIVEELTVAFGLGLRGGMFHIGAHQGADRDNAIDMLVEKSKIVLGQIPKDVLFILENSATDKKLGARFDEIGIILKKLNHPQVKVCIDTCHAFSSGYELRTKEGVDEFVNEIEKYIGLSNLEVIHVNDSKADFDSNVDRHENIGQGNIGIEGFKYLLNHPKLKDMPFILEVPGENKSGPNKENVDVLRGLIIQ